MEIELGRKPLTWVDEEGTVQVDEEALTATVEQLRARRRHIFEPPAAKKTKKAEEPVEDLDFDDSDLE